MNEINRKFEMKMLKPTLIGRHKFRNPVITASGTYGMGFLFEGLLDESRIGGITLKTITHRPRKGNQPPRILETPCGLLNSIGLENAGYEAVLRELKEKDLYSAVPTSVILSIAGDTVEDYIEMVSGLNTIKGIDVLELNLSCPNVHAGGATFDSDTEVVRSVVQECVKVSEKPITTKLSPNVPDIVANAVAAEDAGTDGLTLSNTYLGMAFNLRTGEPFFKNKVAGFSGPAVKPMALYQVYRVSQKTSVPIIASGGIASVKDAAEFIMAGASFISIGTMGFVEPNLAEEIARNLPSYFDL